ncbi:MAG TPA: hypothetical protein VGB45_02670 [Abditibacterium sp.]
MHEGILISYGGAIKSLEVKGDLVTVGDYGLLWGSEDRHDLVGDYYTPQTFLGARGGLGVDTLLHHGIPLSRSLKSYSDILLPPTIKAEPDEHGLLVATILDRRDAYQRKMYELSEEGALSWSSGAISRAVKRRDGVKCGEVTQWPIQEFSFTPTPCEPRMIGITTLDEVKTAPLDWFKEPSYAKAVRVLTDLKGGSKSTGAALARGEEVKSILFPYDYGASATASVVREACDRLTYNVLYDVFSPTTGSQQIGLTTLTTPTQGERLAYLRSALDEFGDFVYTMAETILALRGDEKPEDAAKALRSEFLNLKAVSPDGMRFADDSDRVLATCEEFIERVTDLVETRSASRKSGRVLSQNNYERLSKHHSSMKELWEELGQLLELHTPGESAAVGTGEGEESKSFDDELTELELKFHEFELDADLSALDSESDGADAAI